MASSLDPNTLFRVDGLVAVISGGGTGIGLMMAKALAANGAKKVYIIGRRLETLETAAKQSPHGNIIPMQGDVTDKDSLAKIAQRIKQEVGYINFLVCNSGKTGPIVESLEPGSSLATIQNYMWAWEPHAFNSTYELNDTAAFFTVVAFLELLDAGNKANNRPGIQSQVVITASVAALSKRLATGVAYTTSKAAAVHLAKVLCVYFAPYQIRVNSLCPGIFPSEMTEGHVGASAGFSTNTIPLGRLGSEEDIAGTILWLSSRAGGYVNGLVLLIDGGRLSMIQSVY